MEEALERARARPDVLAALAFVTPQLAAALDAAGQFARAEPFYAAALEQALKQFGPNDPRSAAEMAAAGRNLLMLEKWAEAEPMLRECLADPREVSARRVAHLQRPQPARRQPSWPEEVRRGRAALARRLRGNDGPRSQVPAKGKPRLTEAGKRLVKLYEAWGKTDKAAEWRKKLGPQVPRSFPRTSSRSDFAVGAVAPNRTSG